MKPKAPKSPAHKNTFPLNHIVGYGIDKLRISFSKADFDADRLDFLRKRFNELRQNKKGRPWHPQGNPFKESLLVKVNGENIQIDRDPGRENFPFAFAIEFNPNNHLKHAAKTNPMNNVLGFLKYLLGHDAQQLLRRAFISRLDLNVDFNINVLENTLAHAKGKQGGTNVMCDFGRGGVLGSLYVGALGSDRRVCIYNKAAEVLTREFAAESDKMLAALASPKWNTVVQQLRDKNRSNPPRWRVEVRCLPDPAHPVAQIADFGTCLDHVKFLHLPTEQKAFNTSLGRTFVALARHVGIPVALQGLDPNDRRSIDRAINKLDRVEWWNGDVLRAFVRKALDQLTPLFHAPDIELPQIDPTPESRTQRPVFARTGISATAKPKPQGSPASTAPLFPHPKFNAGTKPEPKAKRPSSLQEATTPRSAPANSSAHTKRSPSSREL